MLVIPATWEAETEGSLFEASQGKSQKDPISKINWAWWCTPVIPATGETKIKACWRKNSTTYLKNTKSEKDWGCGSSVRASA
jgi:hypothetical protein